MHLVPYIWFRILYTLNVTVTSMIQSLVLWFSVPQCMLYTPFILDSIAPTLFSGVAFLALYDSVFPGQINMDEVSPNDGPDNLKRAFDLFEKNLGVPQMLKVEDVDVS